MEAHADSLSWLCNSIAYCEIAEAESASDCVAAAALSTALCADPLNFPTPADAVSAIASVARWAVIAAMSIFALTASGTELSVVSPEVVGVLSMLFPM